jgi:signal transduction histidine kinase
VVGIVAVPQDPPPLTAVLLDVGPSLAGVAMVLLVAGTAVAALLIFRPTRRRLQELQDAAKAIGEGEVGVRAPESGGDEVTALSRAFNEMAGQLENRTEALETADRTRRQLLADVSHELTTPLAAILGYVETLRMADLELDESTRARYLRIVNDEADRLEHIVGDLLDLARLEGGGGSLRMEAVSIAHLLERVRHRHAPLVADRHISLTTEQDPIVGVLKGDQNRLEQALQNLVANAIRHTPDGGAVTVTARVEGANLALRVDDTGPGIPPDQLVRVFDRFYKVDESRTGTKTPSGSGLGLSIVQTIVNRHGGTVSAANLRGGGARFEIVLPLALPDVPA